MVTRGFEAKYRILELLELRGKPCISAYDFKFQQLISLYFSWMNYYFFIQEEIQLLRQKLKETEMAADQDRFLKVKLSEDSTNLARENAALTQQMMDLKKQLDRVRYYRGTSFLWVRIEDTLWYKMIWLNKVYCLWKYSKVGGGCNIAARNKEIHILNIMFHVGLTTKNNIYTYKHKVMHICVVRGISVNLICL